jgi:2-succinyl-6-hydroxy-2,4-cyclohexadiene-1-carboxylate synthase
MANGFGVYRHCCVCDVASDHAIGKTLMKQETIATYQFSYSDLGQSDGIPILFLHGFMGDRYDFNAVISPLTDSFRCLSLDLPGHGQTIVIGDEVDYGMSQTAQAIVHWLDQFNISQCFLVGYSMGGRLALYLTIHFPRRFIKVVLESASPGLATEAEQQRRVQQDQQLAATLETGDFSEFLQNWYRQPLFCPPDLDSFQEQQAREMGDRRRHNQPLELAKSLRQMGTGSQPSLWQELAHIQVPLLLLVGELDQKFIHMNQEMLTHCKTAKLQMISGCRHNIHWEQPQNFVAKLQMFFGVFE